MCVCVCVSVMYVHYLLRVYVCMYHVCLSVCMNGGDQCVVCDEIVCMCVYV